DARAAGQRDSLALKDTVRRGGGLVEPAGPLAARARHCASASQSGDHRFWLERSLALPSATRPRTAPFVLVLASTSFPYLSTPVPRALGSGAEPRPQPRRSAELHRESTAHGADCPERGHH